VLVEHSTWGTTAASLARGRARSSGTSYATRDRAADAESFRAWNTLEADAGEGLYLAWGVSFSRPGDYVAKGRESRGTWSRPSWLDLVP